MRHATILVAVLAFGPLAGATAQVGPGERVRVTFCTPDLSCAGSSRISVGTLLAWKADSLVVESDGDTLAVPLDMVTGLDVSLGQKSRTLKGAGIGALVGAAAGLATAAIACAIAGDCYDDGLTGLVYAYLGGLGAVAGALTGAIIGSTMEVDRWVDVPLDRLRVSFGPQRDGRFGLGLSVRF